MRHASLSLLKNRLRSLLSTLGIACGVSSFLLMMSVGEGARRETLSQLEGLGMRNVVLRAATLSAERREAALRMGSRGLALSDGDRVLAAVAGAGTVAGVRELQTTIYGATRELSPLALEVTPALASVQSLSLASGRFIAATDVAGVCVLGSQLSRALGAEGAVGASLRVGGSLCRVVGVLSPSHRSGSKSAVATRDLDQALFLPFSGEAASELVVAIRPGADVTGSAGAVRRVMEVVHHGAGDYQVIVPEELLRQSEDTRSTFDFLLTSIGLISLLMGGIGTMNMMLASVAERTHEIGLRRALGATRDGILGQFLVEVLILTWAGSALGIVCGLVGLLLLSARADWAFCLTPWSVVAPLLMSAVVGLGFGIYPALKAARLDPVEALRF